MITIKITNKEAKLLSLILDYGETDLFQRPYDFMNSKEIAYQKRENQRVIKLNNKIQHTIKVQTPVAFKEVL